VRREQLLAEVALADRKLRNTAVDFTAGVASLRLDTNAYQAHREQLAAAARAFVRAEDRLARGGETDFSEARVASLNAVIAGLHQQIRELQERAGRLEDDKADLVKTSAALRGAAYGAGMVIAQLVAAIGPCAIECGHPACIVARRATSPIDATASVKAGAA